MNPLLPITRALIYVNVGAFLVQSLSGDNILYRFALWPWGTPLFHVWQLVTYSFLHASWPHLLLNMFGLYMFGPDAERFLGARRYLVYYFVCVLGAAVLHLIVSNWMRGIATQVVGASGGVIGVVLAFGMLFPHRRLLLYFVIPIQAWVAVSLYAVIELGLGVFGTDQGVAHFAHLGGMLAGFLLLSYWRKRPAYD